MPFASLADALKTTGLHHDSQNLFLKVKVTELSTSASWLFIYEFNGKRCELGLGSAIGIRGPKISRQQARRMAAPLLVMLGQGKDPKTELLRQRQMGKPFSEVAAAKIALLAKDWKNADKMRVAWTNSLKSHGARLWARPVSEISDDDVIVVLRPLWTEKPAMAEVLRLRIEAVLDYAVAINSRPFGPNPARTGYVKDRLGARPDNEKARAAMPLGSVPGFYSQVAAQADIKMRALQMTILTALRGNEVINMRWDELDLDKGVWTLPPARMKGSLATAKKRERDDQPHIVTLSDEMRRVLSAIQPVDGNPHVFASDRVKGAPVSHASLRNCMAGLGVASTVATPHGFRSCLLEFVKTYPHPHLDETLAHWCLDHSPATGANAAVEKAYNRGMPVHRAGQLWQRWSDFVTGKFGQIVPLQAEKAA